MFFDGLTAKEALPFAIQVAGSFEGVKVPSPIINRHLKKLYGTTDEKYSHSTITQVVVDIIKEMAADGG
jgi:hypothetical protein